LFAASRLPFQQREARQSQQVLLAVGLLTHSQATEALLGRLIMAHFARIEHNTVREVNVINNAVLGDVDFPESEPVGQAFIVSLGISGEWKQTSYSGSFRSKYAAIGDLYDPALDIFTSPPVEDASE
jgi:hypothetical protein